MFFYKITGMKKRLLAALFFCFSLSALSVHAEDSHIFGEGECTQEGGEFTSAGGVVSGGANQCGETARGVGDTTVGGGSASSRVVVPAFSLPTVSFVLEPRMGLSSSYFSDYLYGYGSIWDKSKRLISRLDWRCDNILKLGFGGALEIDFSLVRLSFEGSCLFNIPNSSGEDDGALYGSCGTMYDSDWQTPGMKTSLSVHEVETPFGYDFTAGMKLCLPVEEHFTVSSRLSFVQYYSKLCAGHGDVWKGTTRYTGLDENVPWNSDQAVFFKKKTYGIDLFNTIKAVFVDTGFDLNFSRFSINGNIGFAPWVLVHSQDHHHGKEGGSWYDMKQESWMLPKLEFESGERFWESLQELLKSQWNINVWKFALGAGVRIIGENSLNFNAEAVMSDLLMGLDDTAFSFTRFDFAVSYGVKIR